MHPDAADAPISLEAYAPPSSTTCTVCTLPQGIRDEIERARNSDAKRFTYPVISAWLGETHDRAISDSSLRRHFNRSHDRQRAGVQL